MDTSKPCIEHAATHYSVFPTPSENFGSCLSADWIRPTYQVELESDWIRVRHKVRHRLAHNLVQVFNTLLTTLVAPDLQSEVLHGQEESA